MFDRLARLTCPTPKVLIRLTDADQLDGGQLLDGPSFAAVVVVVVVVGGLVVVVGVWLVSGGVV